MMSLTQPAAYKSQQNHKSSHRCLPHSINTVSIWLSVVYQSAEYVSRSLASPPLRQALMENTQYYINSSGFTLSKCLSILLCCQSCYDDHLLFVYRVKVLDRFFFLDTSSIRLHVLFLREPNLQTQTFAFPVKWSSYRLLKAWSSRTLKVAGGYDNFAHNKAAAAAAVSLLTWAGLNAPSLHIKNTTVYAQHLISHLKTRPTIIVLKKISEIMQQQKNNN